MDDRLPPKLARSLLDLGKTSLPFSPTLATTDTLPVVLAHHAEEAAAIGKFD